MVEIDWNTFTGIKPEKMTEQEKDDLCDTVTWFIPDFNLDRKYLIHFVRVIQEVLKFKAEQVELLTTELDDLAAKQGKEEGSKLHQYLEEIEQLKEELEYHKKFDRSSSLATFTSNDELKQEMIRLEIQNEDLLSELKEKEKELLNEKEEVERFAAQVATLEREKQELARELRVLQDEATEKSARSLKDSPETGAERQELTEIIRQKNRHISQLLEDMEAVEEENLSLRTKLTSVRDELAETTTHMTEITAELAKLKHLNEEYKTKNEESEEKIKSLVCQIEELVEEKAKHDRQLDEYILMFNTKLQEWNDEVDAKDEEIMKLKDEMKKLSSPRMFTDSGEKDSRIPQLEREIEILQQELQKATADINSSSELIEKLKEKQLQLVSAPVHSQSIRFFEERIKLLEEKLSYAEEDAQVKAEEMSDLVIQLREYESGVFGLSEAVVKIKKLEKHVQERDLQIEKLVEICNHLEIKLDNFEEQNMALRERLGLSLSDEIDTTGVKLRYEKDEELMENLKLQLDRKEEELIKAKLKYRKVVKFLKLSPKIESHVCPKAKPDPELNKKLKMIIKENDALRKGMHEILESIREQDRSGAVEVQSTCLERLLEALDSRHISGWYHPAMRLQAQLSTEEGKNEELRNQIRSLRTEEKKRASELQNAYLKIQSLESDLSTPRYEEKIQTEVAEPEITFKTAHDPRIIELESKLQESRLELDRRKVELEKLEEAFASERENFQTQLAELETQNKQLKTENPDLTKLSELTSQVVVLERRVSFLQRSESSCRENNDVLRERMIEEEGKMLKEVLKLQNDKSNLVAKVEELEENVLNAVPKDKYDTLTKKLAETKAKYQNAISLALVRGEEKPDNLHVEVSLLEEEKQKILEELKATKEKLIATEGLISEEVVTKGDLSNEVSVLAGKLAASEVREMNEKQKSAHLEKINEMLKTQQEEVEARNKELLSRVTNLTEEMEKQQATERELRVRVSNRISEEEEKEMRNKMENLEKKCRELTAEKDNVQELFEISQGQCRAFQEWRDSDKMVLSALNDQILLLQSTDDDKAKISRLSHELTMCKLSASELSKKNSDLKIKLTKLLSQNLSLELKIEDDRREFVNARKKHLAVIEYLYEAMDEVRELYGAAVRFWEVEDIYKAKAGLKEKENAVLEKTKELRTQIHEYSVKREEMETQLESLEDLKLALKGDTKNLIAWHNKTTELRLKEAKQRRENEHLLGEISRLENRLKRLNEEISALEEGSIRREKEWERKQILWERAQLEVFQEKRAKSKKFSDAATNTENSEESQKLKACEWKMQELEEEVIKLRKQGEEKKALIAKTDKLENEEREEEKIIELEETSYPEKKVGDAEKEALKMTVQSLQNIIQQKEETILKYQGLLKEGREEYGRACAKLQEELRGANESLAAQSKAYNKLKNAVQANHFANENIPSVVEKYFTKIQELEEELRECQMNLSSVSTQAYTNRQEVDKWRSLAEERLQLVEELRQRVGSEQKNDEENWKEEVRRYQKENERLNQFIELLRSEAVKGESVEGRLEDGPQFQGKSLDQETETTHLKSDQLSDCTFDKPQRQRGDQMLREVESLKRQLKFSRDESTRLREQIRVLQARRRPKTAGSSTSRSDSKSSVKEESLTSKIKHLEELLTVSKERERELMEINQKKLKSTAEVARWEERKKNQQTIQNLTAKLKEKEAEVEVLKTKNESFRNMVYKCERDKTILEAQLKVVKGGPGGVNAKIEKLTMEKKELEAEVNALRCQLEEQMRHSGGLGAALLQEKLEEQERKLVAFQLASMGQNALVDELEKLKLINSNLEKTNLRLESENLSLQLKLEKEKGDMKFLLEKAKHYRDTTEEIKRQESDQTVARLHKALEKLTEENKRLRCLQKETRCVPAVQKVRMDLAKLREEYEALRGKYLEAVERNAALEEELKSCHYQIHLMEEKDLAEALTRNGNFQATSELSRELSEAKAKLAHKTHLLGRVKALLVKAAAKEKALLQQVAFLQSVVPKTALHAQG